MQRVSGAQVAAEAYADKASAKDVFGFDILGAGLLPVITSYSIHYTKLYDKKPVKEFESLFSKFLSAIFIIMIPEILINLKWNF